MIILTDMQKIKLAVSPVSAEGNPAPIDSIAWTSSDESIVTLEAIPDDLFAVYAVAVGPLGQAQVVVEADALVGEGVVAITGILDVSVVASQAVSLAIATGVAEPK